MNDTAQTATPEPAAPWPSLEAAEHALQTKETLAHGHLVREAVLYGVGGLAAEDRRLQTRLAHLEDSAPPPGADDLDLQLLLAQERVAQIEERLAALQANRAALQKEEGAAQAALAEAEEDMRQAQLDQKEAARQFSTRGNTGLLAARARHDRARQAAGDERHRRSVALWRAISAREYREAGEGIRHLARAWAARSKAADQSLTMQKFVAMAFGAVLPTIEAQAALERALRAEFFPAAPE